MPTDTPPGSDPTPQNVQFRGRNLTLTTDDEGAAVYVDDAGAQFIPYGRFRKVLDENKTLKESSGKPADTDAIRKQIRGEVEAEYAPKILANQVENALIRAGLASDEEALEEALEKYQRAKPGEDGKKLAPSAWLAAEQQAGRLRHHPDRLRENGPDRPPHRDRPPLLRRDPPPLDALRPVCRCRSR